MFVLICKENGTFLCILWLGCIKNGKNHVLGGSLVAVNRPQNIPILGLAALDQITRPTEIGPRIRAGFC